MRAVAEELAALPLDAPDALDEALARRDDLVRELATCAPPPEADRADVRALLERAQAAADALTGAAREAMRRLDDERDRVRGGRHAVRGYRNASPHGAGAIIQTA